MSPERWQKVKEIVQQALGLNPADRAVFLEEACRADSALREDVDSLLASAIGGERLERKPITTKFGERVSQRSPAPVADAPADAIPTEVDYPQRSCAECGTMIPAQATHCPHCGSEFAEPSAQLPSIAGYRILRRLGQGGMGAVYLAHDLTLGRQVAIKELASWLTQGREGKARFLREARTMATVEHPRVVRVYSFSETRGAPCIVMEFVEGESLQHRISRSGKLSVEDALKVTEQVVDGLSAAWARGIVHRDIKPSNILLDASGDVHVGDFGLAKPVDDSAATPLTTAGLVLGTPHYMSPEQALGREADHRSDMYSLGIVLYEMLTGERPFRASQPLAIITQHLHEPLPPLAEKRRDVPHKLVRLVERLTAKDPKDRPASYRALQETLRNLGRSDETEGARAQPSFLQDLTRTLSPTAVTIGVCLVLGGSLFVWKVIPRRDAHSIEKDVPAPTLGEVQTPTSALRAVVRINALPWARVKITPLKERGDVPLLSDEERTTPCLLELAEGEYELELENGGITPSYRARISVASGKANDFVYTMPGFDPESALSLWGSVK